MRILPYDPFRTWLAGLQDHRAKARVAARIRAAGPGRESFYKALTPGSKLRYETVRKVMDVLGVKLTAAAGSR